MTNPDYQCRLCKTKYKRQPVMQKKHQDRKGCFEQKGSPCQQYLPQHNMVGYKKILYYKCPTLFYDRGASFFIDYYHSWTNGIMPYSGTYLEQPAKFVEVMDLVHNLLEEHKKIIEEKQKSYGKRSKR